MKRNMRKVITMLLTVAMMLTMTVIPAFAETTSVNGTVTGLSSTTTSVTAYKVIGLDSTSPSGYKDLTGGSIEDKNGNKVNSASFDPDNIAWSTLPADVSTLTSVSMTTAADGDTVTATGTFTEPGMYMIKATDSDSTVTYNPMVLSINKDDSGNLTSTDTVAKPSSTTIVKEAHKDGVDSDNANDLQIGDTVVFTVTTTIPTYADGVTTGIEFIINDTVSAGLDIVSGSASYTIGGTTMSDPAPTTTSSSLSLDLSDIAKANAGKTVVLTYKATLNENAVTNSNANTNVVELTYKNGPSDTEKYVGDKTNHYTFEIDANATGHSEVTHNDVLKTGEITGSTITTETVKLNGAIFNLYTSAEAAAMATADDDATTAGFFATTTSGANGVDGSINFKGLDGDKEYYMVEVKAPDGYSLDKKVVKVKINATYAANTETVQVAADAAGNAIMADVTDNVLTGYSVLFDDATAKSYTYDNKGDLTTTTTSTDYNGTKPIINTKVKALPSTGGIGTYLFTIIGAAIICFAGIVLVKGRKHSN